MSNKNNIKSAFLGLAIGDALGVPVEFNSRTYLKTNPVIDMLEYQVWNQPKGTWSDDSSMTFCLAESLISGFNPKNIGENFVKWYREGYWGAHYEVFDIGGTTRDSLTRIHKGESALYSGNMFEEDNGNGSLMRNIPMAFFLQQEDDLNVIYEKIKIQSSITHAHFRSVFSCFIHAIFTIEILNGKDKFEAYSIMKQKVSQFIEMKEFHKAEIDLFHRILNDNIFDLKEDAINSGRYVLDTLEASLWCLLTSNSYSESVLKAVNLGEDTDTTACVTGGLAGIYFGEEQINLNWTLELARKKDIEELADRFYDALSQKSTLTSIKNIEILQGDITKLKVDAVVNAANSSLLGGGGVDGAIHRAGGNAILEACQQIRNKQGKCKTGEAVITTAGNLPANYVIHTVGPVYNGGKRIEKEKELLANCYKNSLLLADENKLKTVAFPNISTGIYKFPKKLASEIAMETVLQFKSKTIEKVIFICFDDENYFLYKQLKNERTT